MNLNIEKYITGHSSSEDPLLSELFRQTHIRFVNPNMVTGHIQGKFLEFISRMISPAYILEIGTFTGYSAICLARGLKENGELFTIEINDELTEFSKNYFQRAGLGKVIHSLTGRAQEIIPIMNIEFDLVYIDGDKREYCEYFKAALNKTKKGGFIIADNVLWGNKVLESETRDQQTRGVIEFNKMIACNSAVEKVIVPLRDGLTIMRVL